MAASEDAIMQQASHVHTVDGLRSLDEFINDHGTTLVSVFHPLFPRWQRFSPVFDRIAESLSQTGSKIKCVKVNAAGQLDLVDKFLEKPGYPVVALCQPSGEFKRYHGALREDDVLSFLARQAMHAVTDDVDDRSVQQLKDAHQTVIVAYLGPDHVALRGWFIAIAEDMRDDFVFCTSSDPGWLGSIIVYKNVHEEMAVGQKFSSDGEIRDFIQRAARPMVGEILPELHEDLLEQHIPLGYIFLGSSVERRQVVEDFLPVARDYEARIVFGTVDVTIFSDLLDTMHVTMGSDGLAFAVHEPVSNEKYPLMLDDKSTQLTPERVSAFVHDFLDGKLKPTIRSASIPNAQEGPVVEVVGLTYKDIVLDPEKDVLVEFYTPWCGPCKALLPMYEKLASLYASDERGRERVTIAKIDYEANDVPDKDIRGFPWFKLYPGGRKGEPVTYDGGRTVEEWVKFIAAEGSHGVVLDANKTG